MYFIFWNSKSGFVSRFRQTDVISAENFARSIYKSLKDDELKVADVRILDFNKGAFVKFKVDD